MHIDDGPHQGFSSTWHVSYHQSMRWLSSSTYVSIPGLSVSNRPWEAVTREFNRVAHSGNEGAKNILQDVM